MKKALAMVVLVLTLAAVATAASMPERVSPYRPGAPGLFYSLPNQLAGSGDWGGSGAVDKLVWHGWPGVTAHWADFNGDDIDDKTLVQNVSDGVGNTFKQIVVTYSGPDGDISNTNFNPPTGETPIMWGDWPAAGSPTGRSMLAPLFGDLDGDGIDDNAAVVRQTSTPASAPLNWGAYVSAGTPGVNTTNFVNWSPFGVEADQAALGDINGDGFADRITWHEEVWPDGMNVDIRYLWMGVDYSAAGGWGDGGVDEYALLYCGEAATYLSGDCSLGITDIDGDGLDDVALIRKHASVDVFELFGWYTDPGSLTGLGAPATQAWGGIADASTWAGTPSLGDVMLFAQLDPVPEPATLALLGLGVLALRRRK